MVATGYNFEKVSVLVCDDSRQIRSLIKTCLMSFGVKRVAEASNADEGFAKLVEHKPDLVITDWNMPPTSGLELVRRIRQSDDSPDPYVPIIMLTGHTELGRVKTARDNGVSSFLAKPMSVDSLYKRIVNLVEDHRPFIRSGDFFGPDRRFNATVPFGGDERRGGAANAPAAATAAA
ncbi:MAG: response regulator [Rhodospirillales bacterium]|nr:response regulator [Rhodospirillales bacterium]